MKTALTLEHLLDAIHKRGIPARTLPPIPEKNVTFKPAARPPFELPLMEGRSTGYGLVVHLSCISRRANKGYFGVSDLETGAQVCGGAEEPGYGAAMDALAKFIREWYAKNPKGDFRAVLKKNRKELATPEDFERLNPRTLS